MQLSLITAPSVEPISLTNAKLYARIAHSVDDTIINGWITAGRQEAETHLRRAFISQLWELSLDEFPDMPLFLSRPPLLQLKSIKYTDYSGSETTLYNDDTNPISTTEETGTEPSTNSDFIVDTSHEPGRIDHTYGKVWPSAILQSINSVKIRYFAGYGNAATDVPQCVKEAIYLYCTFRNENRAGEGEFPRQFYDLLSPVGRSFL